MSFAVNKYCTIAPGQNVSFVVVTFSRLQAVNQHELIYSAVCDAIRQANAAHGFEHVQVTLVAPEGAVPLWSVYREARAKLQRIRGAFRKTRLAFTVVSKASHELSIVERSVAQCLCIALGVTWSGESGLDS